MAEIVLKLAWKPERARAMLRYVFHDHEEVNVDVDNHAGELTAPRSARHVWSGDGVLDRG